MDWYIRSGWDGQKCHSSTEYSPIKTECYPTTEELMNFPSCLEKLTWIMEGRLTHDCYTENGVNETLCSHRRYLSEVESHCPLLPGQTAHLQHQPIAKLNHRVEDLFTLFSDTPQNYVFIRRRIIRLWPQWLAALELNDAEHPLEFKDRRRLKGGPLGELVQWSDLLAALHILGHQLIISTETPTFLKNIDGLHPSSPCPNAKEKGVDLVFTDIMGLRALKQRRKFYLTNKCKFRLLDSFGTQAQFNTKDYFLKHRDELGGKKNPWGGHALNLKQFLTLYPHTDDNTFLGFVVATENVVVEGERRSGVLVYGKEKYMWEESSNVVQFIQGITKVHATVGDAEGPGALPAGVINHGFLDEAAFHSLLTKVKAFVGLGFPFEGPAPLEAVAHGAVFINPSFSPPKGRLTDPFFFEKPTLRALTSQCPYLEKMGQPWVHTVDIKNETELRTALETALSAEITPHVPYELTAGGMLLRVAVLTAKMDTCSDHPAWPPKEALLEKKGKTGESCEVTCKREGLVCESVFFPVLNTEEKLHDLLECLPEPAQRISSVVAPYKCALQDSSILYSCSASEADKQRVCPCRNFLHEQRALCSKCVL